MVDSASNEQAIEMYVGGLVVDPNTQAPVVILKDESGELVLPIWIGATEAASIAVALKQEPLARPLTHDLFNDVLSTLQASVERVLITSLKEGTYFAELVVSVGDRVLIFDSRPSDAIALALRSSAPIYVASEVLKVAKINFSSSSTNISDSQSSTEDTSTEAVVDVSEEEQSSVDFTKVEREQWKNLLDTLDIDDFKYKQ
jgi:uncharacterized protein